MRKINHFGIPCTEKKEGSSFIEPLGVWVTDYSNSDNKIEFLYFEPNSCMHELIKNVPHIAYEVPSMSEAINCKTVLLEPMISGEGMQIAFIAEEGIPIELISFE